jgi:hypothetical protein
MTRATYEAMHREIQDVRIEDLERKWAERYGSDVAHELMLVGLRCVGLEPPSNVVQGPW